jgi:hypothetical protein
VELAEDELKDMLLFDLHRSVVYKHLVGKFLKTG